MGFCVFSGLKFLFDCVEEWCLFVIFNSDDFKRWVLFYGGL